MGESLRVGFAAGADAARANRHEIGRRRAHVDEQRLRAMLRDQFRARPPIGRGDGARRRRHAGAVDEAPCARVKGDVAGADLMRGDGGDGDDALRPVLESIRQFGGHRNAVNRSGAKFGERLADRRLQMRQAQMRRAGALRHGDEPPAFRTRGLHMRAADVPTDNRWHPSPALSRPALSLRRRPRLRAMTSPKLKPIKKGSRKGSPFRRA
jgi:hypothetical protein